MGAGAGPDFHAPQHFLYFLPLPHGHGSFLPVFAIALLLGLREAARFSLESAAPWPARFTRFWLFSRKHAHHPISAVVFSTRRRCGFSASLARIAQRAQVLHPAVAVEKGMVVGIGCKCPPGDLPLIVDAVAKAGAAAQGAQVGDAVQNLG